MEENILFEKSKEVRDRLFTHMGIPCYMNLQDRITHFEKNEEIDNKKEAIIDGLDTELFMHKVMKGFSSKDKTFMLDLFQEIINMAKEEIKYMKYSYQEPLVTKKQFHKVA